MVENCPLRFLRFILTYFIFSVISVNAQTSEQLKRITASYNNSHLQSLSAKSLEKSTREKSEAITYAKARNIPITYTTEKGAFVALQKVLPDGTLIYYTTHNADAAKSTRVDHLNTGGSTGFDLEGQNMIVHVWDSGHPLLTHQEYHGAGGSNRVSVLDSLTEPGAHATHVIGTIASSGVNSSAKGMAPRSIVKAYDWSYDLSEAAEAASSGMLLSNHSYGWIAEDLPAYLFGSYEFESKEWDDLMFNSPYYLMVKSAGNDGNDTHFNSDPLFPGYDMLTGRATAKNNLVVAAANDANVDGNGELISVDIASFSNPGPTDDLRIKPDITGNGVGVYSTLETSDDAYAMFSGTSMSAPNVTGSLLLLQEHYNNINTTFMRAATLKGLALHTADDAGPVGPDARWGWGLLNAKRAAETITHNGAESLIQEMTITQGQTIILEVDSDGYNDLIASISWTDRPGVASYQLNSTTPVLVNDLDIRISKDDSTYFPWRLTSATTNSNEGDNNVDPFERIEVENPAGTYTITITHKGELVGGSQDFSLIVTGLRPECVAATIPEDVSVNDVDNTTVTVSWTPVSGAIYDLRYREVRTSSWTDIFNIRTNNYEVTELAVFTEYEVEVRSKCEEGEPSVYSDPLSFITLEHNYCDSHSNNAYSYFHISNVNLNTIDNSSSESTYSDFTGMGTELLAGESYTISITTEADNPNYRTNYVVWIDYNRNGVFEPEEKVLSRLTIAGEVVSGSFTVPANISPKSTIMRVSMSNNDYEQSPCDTFEFGEVEDYTVHLDIPSCFRPRGLALTEISKHTATVKWTAGGTEDNWSVSWGMPGYTPGGENEIGNVVTNQEFYQIEGLLPQTEYEVYVQADCAGEGVSSWTGPQSFITLSGLTVTCAPDAVRNTDLGVCEYVVNGTEFDASFTGNGTLINDLNGTSTLAGAVLPVGVTTVVWTITGSEGQSESCTMTIIVEDNEAPTISCPSNLAVETEEGVEYYLVPDYFATGIVSVEDNCTNTVTNLSQTPVPGTELAEGVYTITLNATDDNGNTFSCSFELTVDVALGINNVDYGALSLYPNPTKNVLIVSNPNNILIETAFIFDITGRLVQSKEIAGVSSEISIDVSALPAATYMVVLSGAGGKISKRMIKK